MWATATRPWPYSQGASAAILSGLLGLLVLVGVLAATGILQVGIRWAVWALKAGTYQCFRLWERTLGWMPWPGFLLFVGGLIVAGVASDTFFPWAMPFLAGVGLYAGFLSCLAYIHLDFERVEVERGYKVLSNPGPGQELALDYVRHGHRAPWPLLVAAGVAFILGFTLLNLSIHRYQVAIGTKSPWYDLQDLPGTFADFAAYAVIGLYNVIDMLDVMAKQQIFKIHHVNPIKWQSRLMLLGYKSFFALVLVHQVISALRRSGQLNQLVADFWSPNGPIQERAKTALPLFGPAMVPPLMRSLREAQKVTRETRDELPDVIASAGPSAIPALRPYLYDESPNVRIVAIASLGRLGGRLTLVQLVPLANDPHDAVRMAAVDAISRILAPRSRQGNWDRTVTLLGWLWLWFTPREWAIQNGFNALCRACEDRAPAVRVRSLQALGELGETAAVALPTVRKAVVDEDEDVEGAAVEALVKIGGPAALPDLLSLCDSGRSSIRMFAARALGQLRMDGPEVPVALARLVLDRDEAVSQEAARALARAKALPAEAVSLLEEGLQQEDPLARKRLVRGLGEMGPVGGSLASALVKMLDEDNLMVRAEATEALGKLGEAVPEAIMRLTAALQDEDNWVTALAAEALGKLGGPDNGSARALASALQHPTPEVRANAARALGRLGRASAPILGPLVTAGSDRDAAVRQAAVRSLGLVGRATSEVHAVLRKSLEDELSQVRAAALVSLKELGLLHEDQCIESLQDGSDVVELEALEGLSQLGTLSSEALAAVCAALMSDPNTEVRVKAAQVLGASVATKTVCEGLHEASRSAEEPVRVEALRALGNLGCEMGPDSFVEGMKDKSPLVRRVAMLGWGKVSEEHPQALASLLGGLEDGDAVVRATAAFLLGRRRELPEEAVTPLLGRLQDEEDRVRFHAVVALRTQKTAEVMEGLGERLNDESLRVRLAAARAIIRHKPESEEARKVAEEALESTDETERRLARQMLG